MQPVAPDQDEYILKRAAKAKRRNSLVARLGSSSQLAPCDNQCPLPSSRTSFDAGTAARSVSGPGPDLSCAGQPYDVVTLGPPRAPNEDTRRDHMDAMQAISGAELVPEMQTLLDTVRKV